MIMIPHSPTTEFWHSCADSIGTSTAQNTKEHRKKTMKVQTPLKERNPQKLHASAGGEGGGLPLPRRWAILDLLNTSMMILEDLCLPWCRLPNVGQNSA